ncbi:hypothetical protein [Massilia putida]|uniref:hypothetical protein n=1 Tax=Massilia putida TaxID=1141883 RepID=UPI0012EBC549|nr:hypothetical protein [Massilia putida]
MTEIFLLTGLSVEFPALLVETASKSDAKVAYHGGYCSLILKHKTTRVAILASPLLCSDASNHIPWREFAVELPQVLAREGVKDLTPDLIGFCADDVAVQRSHRVTCVVCPAHAQHVVDIQKN